MPRKSTKKAIKPVRPQLGDGVEILNAGSVLEDPITRTLETNYMPYAMSVIVSRALPEIDGFKPAHRKLLYTMYEMGLLKGARTKSANIVGSTMHLNPHGDAAIYDTMVRMGRGNESLLVPFVDSKGNFGKAYSRDMSCAAARYTEAKLEGVCEELFRDIDKETVDFVPNYDSTTTEPTLLPVTFPTILANNTLGIAVGMACNICSFNLAELCATTVALMKDEHHDISTTMPAPDFVGGGQILYDEAQMREIYENGRGSVKVLDFSTLAIKGRQSQGNLCSRYGIHKIVLKERGTSTLGGQDIWFDEDVRRLNADGRGKLLGEFKGDDRLIVWTSKNQYYITGYDLMQHFPDDTVLVARYESDRVYSLCYYDRGQKYYYMKRFTAEMSDKIQDFLDADADFICVTDRAGAKLEITYKGAHASRPADVIDVDEFVGVKSHRAKGKRLTTYDVDRLRMIEPELPPEPEPSEDESLDDGQLTDASADAAQRAAAEGKASGKSALKEPLGAKPAPGKAPAGQPSAGTIVGGVEFEVERPKGDAGEMIDPEQLNLF